MTAFSRRLERSKSSFFVFAKKFFAKKSKAKLKCKKVLCKSKNGKTEKAKVETENGKRKKQKRKKQKRKKLKNEKRKKVHDPGGPVEILKRKAFLDRHPETRLKTHNPWGKKRY